MLFSLRGNYSGQADCKSALLKSWDHKQGGIMDRKAARRPSLIDDIPGIGKEKAELIGTYLILAVLLGTTNQTR